MAMGSRTEVVNIFLELFAIRCSIVYAEICKGKIGGKTLVKTPNEPIFPFSVEMTGIIYPT